MAFNLNKSLKTRDKLSLKRQKFIKEFYEDLAKYVLQKAELINEDESISEEIKKRYLEELVRELSKQVNTFNKNLQKDIESDMLNTAKSIIKDNQAFLDEIGIGIKNAYIHLPTDVIESILTGQVYKGKWSLSGTIWKDTKKISKDINKIVAEGIAQSKSTYDIAKTLESYVNPNAVKPWDWNKVYPGVKKQIDYNAQRLARTMVQHAYQQTLENTLKYNPFNRGIRWRSALITKRTCQLCRDRHNQIFPKGKLPMDHPNGLCTFIPVMDDLEDVATELADWVNGKSNKGIDIWIKSMKG